MVLKQDDLLKCPPFPELVLDGYSWTCQMQQDFWAGCCTRVDAYRGNQPSDGKIRLCISPVAGPPCAEQVAAYEYLLSNSESVYASLLKAVFDVYPSLRSDYREGYGYSDDMDDEEKEEFEEEYGEWVPALSEPADLKTVVRPINIHISTSAKDGVAFFGFEFDCNWDEEHGLGVLMHRDRVLEVGQADTSFGYFEEPGVVELSDIYGPAEFPPPGE